MSLQALQNKPTPLEERIIEFKGLNRKAYVDDGEMADMKNMSSDLYPTLTQRKARGNMKLPDGCTKVTEMIQRRDPIDGETKLAIVGCTESGQYIFWYGGEQQPIELSAGEKLVAINNKICMFPSKMYFDLVTKTLGGLEFTDELAVSDVIDGISKESKSVEDAESLDDPSNWAEYAYPECLGRILIDPDDTENLYLIVGAKNVTGGESPNYDELYAALLSQVKENDVLHVTGTFYGSGQKQLEANSNYTDTVAQTENPIVLTPYILGTVLEVGKDMPFTMPSFDGKWTIAGTEYSDDPFGIKTSDTNKAFYGIYIKFAQTEFTTLISNIDPYSAYSEATKKYTGYYIKDLKIERVCPNLSHVIEWNNRLWGACDEDNTIYASKLGDPTAWDYFNNTSMDSYYAEQGTNGKWTGCAMYSSHLLFFKENYIHRVYGSAPSSFQTSVIECFGVEEGSDESVATVNNMIFYKSPVGFMCYEGDIPYSISEKFGDWQFDNVVAGARHKKYYASIHMKKKGGYKLLVCDTGNGVWHIEDGIGVKIFRNFKNELLMVDGEGKNILVPDAEDFGLDPVENDKQIPWSAVFGPFDEYIENAKIYSRIQMRVQLPKDATFKVEIATDKLTLEECEWETITDISASEKLTVVQPIIPKRCSRFFIRISGTGRCRIDSMTRKYRQGSVRTVTT